MYLGVSERFPKTVNDDLGIYVDMEGRMNRQEVIEKALQDIMKSKDQKTYHQSL